MSATQTEKHQNQRYRHHIIFLMSALSRQCTEVHHKKSSEHLSKKEFDQYLHACEKMWKTKPKHIISNRLRMGRHYSNSHARVMICFYQERFSNVNIFSLFTILGQHL